MTLRPARTPRVVSGVARPLTVYERSSCHDHVRVVYAPAAPGCPSRSELMVPGTYEGD